MAMSLGFASSYSLSYHHLPRLSQKITPFPPSLTFQVRCMATSTSHAVAAPEPERRSANYMPNLWKHDYIESSTEDSMNNVHSRRIEELKEYARGLLADDGVEPVARLELVDDLRRLGVDYHFKEEIKGVMSCVWEKNMDSILSQGCLYSTALLFRLLRDHLFEISQDVFNNFKDENGCFKPSLKDDHEGLLSLYEALFLAFEGEESLDDARSFTIETLKNLIQKDSTADPTLKERIENALDLPMHWRVQRLQARRFIGVYERNPDMDCRILELSKLDFNMVQSIHRRELKEVSRWWKDLGLADKLSFCRDRVVENYYCVVGALCEPGFWYYRQMMTRIFCLIAAMDDIYDIYGTLEELEIFTDAVVRWDVNATEGLPECMKLCFLALFNTANEIAYNDLKEKGLDITPYIKKAWAELCKAWLVEAKWYHNKENATFEEYLSNSWVSMGWPAVCVHGYFLVTQDVTKEALMCLDSSPDIVRCSSTLIRLWNDLSTSKAEQERGDIPKSIQCHMKEHNVSEEEAHEHVSRLITKTWKELNRDLSNSVILGQNFSSLALDGTRILRSIYHKGDGYARPDKETKASIMALMFDPIP